MNVCLVVRQANFGVLPFGQTHSAEIFKPHAESARNITTKLVWQTTKFLVNNCSVFALEQGSILPCFS